MVSVFAPVGHLFVLSNQLPGSPQAQKIALEPESGNLTFRQRCDHGIMSELFPRVNIGHMNLDNRHFENGEGVPQGVAVMGPGTGINNNGIDLLLVGLVDLLTDRSLEIGLEGLDTAPQLLCQFSKVFVDFI